MKRANTIIMILAGISFFIPAPALFSQEITASKSSQQKQITSEVPPNIETPRIPESKIDIKSDAIGKSIPSYRMRLKDVLKEAEENIKKVDKELSEQEILARNQKREAQVVEACEHGNQLYKEGKLKEAKGEWDRALSISKDKEMRGYIEEAVRKAGEAARKLETETRVRSEKDRFEAQEKVRLEKNTARKVEAAAREAKAKAEAGAREKARLGREPGKKAEFEAQEKARLEKDAARKAEIEAGDGAREKVRIDREAAEKAEAAAKEKAHQESEYAKKAEAELREKEETVQFEKEAADVQNMNAAVFIENLESLYEEAIGYYKDGDIDKAKSAFRKIVKLYPNQTTAQRYLDEEIPKRMDELSET